MPMPQLTRAVDRQGGRLARAVRALQADEAARALDCLIGRGPGLTPSGDDLVTGFLAGLFSTTGDDRARRAFLEAFCLTVAAAAAATADISRAYLTHAADGWFAEPLVTLARQIGAGADRGAIESATSAALRVGHTSGARGRLRPAARPGRVGPQGTAARAHPAKTASYRPRPDRPGVVPGPT